MIEQYIRDKQGRKRGIMVAKALAGDDETYTVGFSVANISKGDYFDKKRGLEIAIGRADSLAVQRGAIEAGPVHPYEIVAPMGFSNQIVDFVTRAERFFKDRTVHLKVVTSHDVPTEEEKKTIADLLEEASSGGSGSIVTRLKEEEV